MHEENGEIHIDENEASAGEKSGHMRWVLAIGLLLAIALLSIIWISGALTQGDVEEEANVSGEIRSTEGAEQASDTTDSIVTEADDGAESAPLSTDDGMPQEQAQ